MTKQTPDSSSNEDHGDETDAPGPWMARFDAAYWQTQVAQAQAERDAALAQLASVKRQLVRTSETLAAERRTAATQRRSSHLD